MGSTAEEYAMSEKNKELLLRANNAVMSRDFELASRIYRNILRTDPDDISVLLKLADSYVKSNDDRKALTTYLKVIDIDASNFKALNSLGGIYRRIGEYDNSIKVLQTALKSGGDINAINYNMGHTYKMMGKYDEAYDCFINVIDENPNDVLAYNHLGSINALRGDHEKALVDYRRGLQIDPNHPILHYNIARSFQALNCFDDAKKSFEAALRSRPGWVDAMDAYSELLLSMNNEKDSKAVLKQAVMLNPTNTRVRNSLGKLYIKQGNLPSAEKMFNLTLSIDKTNITALEGLETVYEKQKKFLDAARIMDEIEKLIPNNNEVILKHAQLLMELDRMHEAGLCIQKVRERDPNDIKALNILAQYFICRGQMGKARGCYKRISEIAPYDVTYLRDTARQLTKMNKLNQADDQLKKYLDRNPKDADGWAALGINFDAMGEWVKALDAYCKSLKIKPTNYDVLKLVAELSRKLGNDPKSMEIISELLAGTQFETATENLDVLSESIRHRENVLKNDNTDTQSHDSYGFSDEEPSDAEEIVDDLTIDNTEFGKNADLEILELGNDIEEAPEDMDLDELLNLEIASDDSLAKDEYESLELEQNDMIDEDIFNDDENHIQKLDGLVKNNEVPFDTDINDKTLDSIDPYENRGIKQNEPVEEQEYLGVEGNTELEDFDEEDEDDTEPNMKTSSQMSDGNNPLNPCSKSEQAPQPQSELVQSQQPQPQPQPQAPVYIMAQGSQVPPQSGQPQNQETPLQQPETKNNEDCSGSLEDDNEINMFPDFNDEPFEEESLEDIQIKNDDELENGDKPEHLGFLASAEEKKTDNEENNKPPVQDDESEELDDYLELDDNSFISDDELETPEEQHLELSDDEIIMDKVRSVLNEVWETPPIKPFATTSEMFAGLRDLCKYLPKPKYDEFKKSLERMKLDYVISRLSGRPGLLAAAQMLREKGAVKTPPLALIDEESVNDTFVYMKNLVDELPNSHTAKTLGTQVLNVIDGLNRHE
jgi:tetratricopeptide (TPR) repeat protein